MQAYPLATPKQSAPSHNQPCCAAHRRLRSNRVYTRLMLPLTSASTSGGMEGELYTWAEGEAWD